MDYCNTDIPRTGKGLPQKNKYGIACFFEWTRDWASFNRIRYRSKISNLKFLKMWVFVIVCLYRFVAEEQECVWYYEELESHNGRIYV